MGTNELITLVINVLIVMAFVVPIRFVLARHLGVNAKKELDTKDNFAFGVATGGGVLGLIFMLTGVMSGDAMAVISEEILSLVVYGIFGSVLMIAGVIIQDKVVIRGVSLASEIKNGNMSAAIVVAANMAIVGLIAKKTISWVDSDGLSGLLPVLVVFLVSQVVLASVTYLRMMVYKSRNARNVEKNIDAPASWNDAVKSGNVAIAIRYAGQVIATGVVISATSLVVDSDIGIGHLAVTWGMYAYGLSIAIWLAYKLFLSLVLFKVDIVQEVDHQRNVGVAIIEAALFIGIAFMGAAYI